jgi:hypothetical protein
VLGTFADVLAAMLARVALEITPLQTRLAIVRVSASSLVTRSAIISDPLMSGSASPTSAEDAASATSAVEACSFTCSAARFASRWESKCCPEVAVVWPLDETSRQRYLPPYPCRSRALHSPYQKAKTDERR